MGDGRLPVHRVADRLPDALHQLRGAAGRDRSGPGRRRRRGDGAGPAGSAAGYRMWVTSRDEAKGARAVEIGADRAFESGARLPEKVDAVMETVGAATWTHSINCCGPGGTVVICGATSGAPPKAELTKIYFRQLRVVGSTMGNRSELERLARFVADRHRPVIDAVAPGRRPTRASPRSPPATCSARWCSHAQSCCQRRRRLAPTIRTGRVQRCAGRPPQCPITHANRRAPRPGRARDGAPVGDDGAVARPWNPRAGADRLQPGTPRRRFASTAPAGRVRATPRPRCSRAGSRSRAMRLPDLDRSRCSSTAAARRASSDALRGRRRPSFRHFKPGRQQTPSWPEQIHAVRPTQWRWASSTPKGAPEVSSKSWRSQSGQVGFSVKP